MNVEGNSYYSYQYVGTVLIVLYNPELLSVCRKYPEAAQVPPADIQPTRIQASSHNTTAFRDFYRDVDLESSLPV